MRQDHLANPGHYDHLVNHLLEHDNIPSHLQGQNPALHNAPYQQDYHLLQDSVLKV
jgi:hypothetical protein